MGLELEINSEADIDKYLLDYDRSVVLIKRIMENEDEIREQIDKLESKINTSKNLRGERITNKNEQINKLIENEDIDEELKEILRKLQSFYGDNVSDELIDKINNLETLIMDKINANRPELEEFDKIDDLSRELKDNQMVILKDELDLAKLYIKLRTKELIDNYTTENFSGEYLIEGFDNSNLSIEQLREKVIDIENTIANETATPVDEMEKSDYAFEEDYVSANREEKINFLNRILNCEQDTNNNTSCNQFIDEILDKIEIEQDLSVMTLHQLKSQQLIINYILIDLLRVKWINKE